MKKKTLVIICLAMLILPLLTWTHWKVYKHGRITMNNEIIGKRSFVFDGKLAFVDIVRNSDQCSVCHTEGLI